MTRSEPLVVEVERSGLVESTHLVDVAVVRSDGDLVASAGDPGTVGYLRSAAKPIQAAVCLETGWSPPGEDAVAVSCASHNAEPKHVEAVRAILAAAGVAEEDLRCPLAMPRAPQTAAAPKRIFHNCSGKHAAMLATAAANGWAVDDYRGREHRLQQIVAARVALLAGATARLVGVDGCGVPTFAFSLVEAARIFGALPEDAPRPVAAMRRHPFLVAGTDRFCTAVIESLPGVLVKTGAEGIMCGSLVERRVGFAVKARDGAARAAEAATVRVLQKLDALGGEPERLHSFLNPPVMGGGRPVGVVAVRGDLNRA